MNDSARQQLRKQMRRRRRSIPSPERAQAVDAINERLVAMPVFCDASSVAFYSAFDGEPDMRTAIDTALKLGKQVALPVLPEEPDEPLAFAPLQPDAGWRTNRFGIAEPMAGAQNRVAPDRFDLVVVPLVAFDRAGNRLGMGGGYYDRTFAFVAAQPRTPRLVGVAFDRQHCDALDPRPWDIPLWCVVTESNQFQTQATEN